MKQNTSMSKDTEIGRGVSGIVTKDAENDMYAWKKSSISDLKSEFLIVAQWKAIPGFVPLLEYDDQKGIKMLRYDMTLRTWLVGVASVPETCALQVATRVASAVATLHSEGWVHSDIWDNNILVNVHGSSVQADLGDFGMCSKVPSSIDTSIMWPDWPWYPAGENPDDTLFDVYGLGKVLDFLLSKCHALTDFRSLIRARCVVAREQRISAVNLIGMLRSKQSQLLESKQQ